jgi:hypothetical protein
MWNVRAQISRRSVRCHVSEMDLTRQRLVTFPREETGLVGLSDRSLPGGGPSICALACQAAFSPAPPPLRRGA